MLDGAAHASDGIKGAGEGSRMMAPTAISSAIDDALSRAPWVRCKRAAGHACAAVGDDRHWGGLG